MLANYGEGTPKLQCLQLKHQAKHAHLQDIKEN